MEKKFFTGMAVLLLGASLFFLGCGGDDEEEVVTPAPSAAETLVNDLGGAAKAEANGNAVTLKDNVELAKEVTIPTDVTLTVQADKTLTVGANGSLVITGTLAGEPASGSAAAAKVVVKGSVTGTGGTNFYAAGTALAAVAAGVYAWDADADGDGTAGWKQTVLDVTATYTLKENDVAGAGDAQSGVSVASATKDTATNEVTITLTGEFKANYVYTVQSGDDVQGYSWIGSDWGDVGASADAGKYAAVYIDGIFPETLTDVAFNIKPYPALVYYKGAGLHTDPLESPVAYADWPNDSALYVNANDDSKNQKWRLYSTFTAQPAGVLLFSGGTTKRITLDIDQYNGHVSASQKTGDLQTVTIDYSAVTFAAPAVQTVTSSYSLKASSATNAAAASSGVTITSVSNNTATGVTITLGGTFTAAHLNVVSSGSGTQGDSFINSDWGGASNEAPDGKYGAVYIDGIFPETLTNVALNIKPYPALVYYKGAGLHQQPLTEPVAYADWPNDSALYVNAGDDSQNQKWRLYDSFTAQPAGILLYSAATTKTVTLDIDKYTGAVSTSAKIGDLKLVTIDYTAVAFPTE
jgi:hypothetical protein